MGALAGLLGAFGGAGAAGAAGAGAAGAAGAGAAGAAGAAAPAVGAGTVLAPAASAVTPTVGAQFGQIGKQILLSKLKQKSPVLGGLLGQSDFFSDGGGAAESEQLSSPFIGSGREPETGFGTVLAPGEGGGDNFSAILQALLNSLGGN